MTERRRGDAALIVRRIEQTVGSQLVEALAKAIREGEYQPRERLPSLREIAARHKVALLTAKRAVAKLAAEGLVKTIPKQGTFVDGASAPARQPDGRAMGLVMGGETSGYGDLVHGIASRLAPLRCFPVLIDENLARGEEQRIAMMDNLNAQNPIGYIIDGGIGVPFTYIEEHLQRLGKVVFVLKYHHDRRIPGAKHALLDYRLGGRMAAEHLIDNGHKSIHFLPMYERDYAGEHSSVQVLLMKGFKDVCAERGVRFDEGLFWDSLLGRLSQADALDILLKRKPRRTGMLAYYDVTICQEILPFLAARGLKVPDDLSLIGVNNNDLAERHNLTSLSIRQERLARCAFELLMGYREEEELRIEPELVVRGSVKNLRR